MEFLFASFRSVSIHLLVSFRVSHKPKSLCPDGRPLFFFSCPRPNVGRLRRPGAARAQPWPIFYFYPLTLISDQDRISPNNINTISTK